MADSLTQQDSPLSITASVAGILTFLVAIVAAAYVRVTYVRNSSEEYFRVKTSLSWYKTESTWLAELVRAAGATNNRPGVSVEYDRRDTATEREMYAFVMDDLVRLEQRILELVAETEEKAASGDEDRQPKMGAGADGRAWPLVPRRWMWSWSRTSVAMAWMPVRAKALELVRQRDALTARVLFTQMSMISSRIRDLEHRANWWEVKTEEKTVRLEDMITAQQSEIRRLEDLVYRVMHKRRLSTASTEGEDLQPPAARSPIVTESRTDRVIAGD
ncbi:hypothetical protein NKR23_g2964 [Pleurostoma richardsiae]|uniref:Uncharacterized protein n=1 Tax=Pleurostoma richardsiae TaxID=41990 RepID=A0AA38RN05_9PEZI|nr:hypothetical protein NKR23_g2964 [Pleurostoma richardsiae]